jgi:hypothetical protein
MADKQISFEIKIEGISNEAIELEKLNLQFVNLTKEYKELQKAVNAPGHFASQDELRQLAAYSKAIGENKDRTKELTRVIDSAPDSLNRMRQNLIKLKDEYANASGVVREKMVPEIKKLNDEVSKSEQAIGVHQRNVGNYPKITDIASGGFSQLSGAIGGTTGEIGNVIGSFAGAVGPAGIFTAAIGAVAAVWKRTQENIELYLKSADKLKAGFAGFSEDAETARVDARRRAEGQTAEGVRNLRAATYMLDRASTDEEKAKLKIMQDQALLMINEGNALKDQVTGLKSRISFRLKYNELLQEEEAINDASLEKQTAWEALEAKLIHQREIVSSLESTKADKEAASIEAAIIANKLVKDKTEFIDRQLTNINAIAEMTATQEVVEDKVNGLLKEKNTILKEYEADKIKINKLERAAEKDNETGIKKQTALQKESIKEVNEASKTALESQKKALQSKYNDDLKALEDYNKKQIESINELNRQLRDEELKGSGPAGVDSEKIIQIQAQIEIENKALSDSNAKRIFLQKQYYSDVAALEAQHAVNKDEYYKKIADNDKKILDKQKADAKESLEIEVKLIEAKKRAYIESKRDSGQALDPNELFELEKETQDKILSLKTDYVTNISGLNADYFVKQKADLSAHLTLEIESTKGNLQAQEELKKKYESSILQIDADAALAAGNVLLKEVEDFHAAEEAKRQAKIESAQWEQERILIDEENKLQLMELTNQSEFEIQRRVLQQQYDAEIESAKKTGADILLIEQKNAAARRLIDKAELKSKLEAISSIAGNLASALGEQTAVGKAAAVAQATINTYLSASSAYAAMSGIPPAPLWGVLAAAAAVAAGLVNVQKIISVPIPGKSSANKSSGYVKGGKIKDGIPINTGTKDDKLIAVNDTETVITDEQMKKLGGPLAMAAAGVPGYGSISSPNNIMLGSGIMNNSKYPMFLNGGSIGIPSPVAQSNSFISGDLRQFFSTIQQNIDATNSKSDAINARIDRLQVINDVNKLNLAQQELSVINTTQRI